MRTNGDATFPIETDWLTRPRQDLNTQSDPWPRRSRFTQANSNAKIDAIAGSADVGAVSYGNQAPSGPTNTPTAVIIPDGLAPYAYSVFIGAGGNYAGTLPGVAETATGPTFTTDGLPVRADFYQLLPGTGDGTCLGYFELNPNGVMTYHSGPSLSQTGSLTVTINPAEVVSAGAQWQVDGGPWQTNGAVVSELSVGSHSVSFTNVVGWTTPTNQAVTVTANQTNTATGTYTLLVQTGSLTVTIGPAAAVSAGARWQVDSGTWQTNGATVAGLGVGGHTVSFNSISGWNTPASLSVIINKDSTTRTNGTYTIQTFSVRVTISPPGAAKAGAQWQLDGGPLQTNGAIVTGLSASNHTVAYKAATGYTFVNWAQDGSVLSTNGSFTFLLNTNRNLVANLLDVQPPVLAIASPTSNQRWSNAVFTVKGTAKDNDQVTNVWVRVNGGGLLPAVTLNQWTNWMVDVALAPGTNTLKAYAVDGAGNLSPTQSVSLVYVLSDRLLVRAIGQGTLTPNYSNAVLELGKSYSMKASGVNGHVFTNWVVSTNWVAGRASTSATLSFLMQSNLTLQANFVDVTKPTLAITAPKANQRWSNNWFQVTGTASDNVQVSNVWCLNNGVWGRASSGNGWSNWTVNATLVTGTNTVRAYAEDAAGNRSSTNSVNFVYVVSDRLVVQATGPGTISPNYSNAMLEIGKTGSMTVTPGVGYVFSNWVGTVQGNVVILSNTPKLTFIMQSNLVLQANIIRNPFIARAGSYYGLVYDLANGVQPDSAGFFSGTLGTGGSLSGKLQVGGRSDSFTGQFDVGGRLRNKVTRSGSTPLELDLQLASDGTLSGVVSNVAWTSALEGYRAVFNAATNPCPYAGRYTMVIPGEEGEPGSPEGSGYGLVTVDKAGQAVMSGTLAEGTVVSQSVPVSQDGDWPLYVSLYSGKGLLMAWLKFTLPGGLTNTAASWIKLTNSASTYYRGGFTNEFATPGSAYVYVKTSRVLALTNGLIVFSGGNLAAPVTNQVLLTATNRFLNLSTNPMEVTVNVTNGYLSGWFKAPGLVGKTNQFKGVLLQEQNHGDGFFLATNHSGRVRLELAP